MSEPEENTETAPKKRSKKPLIIGLVLALAGGAGGFYATSSGMILGGGHETTAEAGHGDGHGGETVTSIAANVSYVAVEPLVVSLRGAGQNRHLKFRANLEVTPEQQGEVEKLLPRVVDVLNSYLRAVDPGDIEDPAALTRLRSQMLRRVQVVTGSGKVNDLLIMEFVLT